MRKITREKAEDRLWDMGPGRTNRIGGVRVTRRGKESFRVDGEDRSLPGALDQIMAHQRGGGKI